MNFSSYSSEYESVCLGWVGGVMFISTVKVPGGIRREGVSEGGEWWRERREGLGGGLYGN